MIISLRHDVSGKDCGWHHRRERIGRILGSHQLIEDDDGFAEAEKKITKLKKMLDSGLISQEDYDSKKAEILSAI